MPSAQIDALRQGPALVEVLVDGVAAGEKRAGDGDFVAHLGERGFASSVKGLCNGIISRAESVKPILDAAVRVEHHALTPVGPAHVADADKERGG